MHLKMCIFIYLPHIYSIIICIKLIIYNVNFDIIHLLFGSCFPLISLFIFFGGVEVWWGAKSEAGSREAEVGPSVLGTLVSPKPSVPDQVDKRVPINVLEVSYSKYIELISMIKLVL